MTGQVYPNECCNDPGNHEVSEAGEGLTVSVCRVCGCRHFELVVDPVEVGADGVAL